MEITKEQLLMIAPKSKDKADVFVPLINRFAKEFGVDTKLRMAHILAQLAHESGEFACTRENMNYTSDRLLAVFPRYFNRDNVGHYARNPQRIGNRVYANRMGNGPEASGDGYNFRGRGLIQLTGKAMYQEYSKYCKVDLLKNPELIEAPFGATRSAFWYFCVYARLLNYADKDDILSITRKINGGTHGLDQRKIYLYRAKLALNG